MDAMGFTLTLDNVVKQGMYPLAPHLSAFDLDDVRSISSDVALPKPITSTIANWMSRNDIITDPVKAQRMQELFQ